MKIAIAQIDVTAGRPDLNVKKIISEIEKSKKLGDDIIVFSELVVPGYLLGDEWENLSFIKDCYLYNEDIKNATEGIVAIWGNVDIDHRAKNEDGRIRKYNSAFIAQNCEYVGQGRTHKTLMPKYREFDDERHFYSLRKLAQDYDEPIQESFKPFKLKINGTDKNIGIVLCEDMWSDDYTINPIEILLKNGSDLLVNLSCSPWTWRKNNKRHSVVRERIKINPTYFIYANNVGVQNNGKNMFLFDGNSTIYNPDGSLLAVAKDYTEETIRANLSFKNKIVISDPDISKDKDKEELFNGLVFGVKKFFDTLPSKKVAIGLSGGIDSALSAAILTEALGAKNVYAINMPSKYNSDTTKDAAFLLAKNLKIHYGIIEIQDAVENTIEDINNLYFTRHIENTHTFNNTVIDNLVETNRISRLSPLNIENIQARDRGGRVLAGVASALGACFVNNGNKTETAFGYATLYGDINGAISIIGDLYKHEVYDMCKYYNKIKGNAIIPTKIFEIPASAELSDEQDVDAGKGDPMFYPYHDNLVKAFVEFRLDPTNILSAYINGNLADVIHCDKELINKYFKTKKDFIDDLEHKWRSYKIAYFKRIQSPPIITVSRRAFGFDLRESQNGFHYTRRYLELKKLFLS